MCKTHKDSRRAGSIDRLPGERWPDFSARQRAAQLAAMTPAARRRRTTQRVIKRSQETYEDRRDDIGESPDR